MADKKVILEVELIEGNANSKLNELKASLQSLDKTHKDYKPTLQLIAQAERDLAKAQQNRILVEKGLAGSTVKVEKATKKTAKEMKQLSSSTGASTSATLELGRVFSDMPYGIRGVANNIQQLASNLFFMSKKTNEATGKTVGFGGAIVGLLKNLIGPAGILVAFQAGVALLDYLSANTDKATNSVSELKEEFNDLASAMSSNANVSVEKYIELLKDKQFLEKEVTKSTEKLKTIEEELAGIRFSRARTNDFEKRQELNRKEKVFLEQIEQVYRDTATAINVYNDKKKQLNAAEEGTVRALEKQKSELIANQKTISNTSKIWKEEAEKIKVIQAEIDAITGGKNKKGGKVKKISPFKTPKELELDVKNNEKALIDFNKKLEEYGLKTEMNNKLSDARTEEDRFDIKKLYATKLLTAQIDAERETLKLNKSTELEIAKAKTAAHVADIKRAFELFKIKTELDTNLSKEQKEKLIGEATGKLSDSLAQADKEIKATEKGIIDRYKPIFKLFEKVKDARFAALFSGFKDKDKEKQESDLDKWKRYAESAKAIISTITDFVDGEFERELTIEQNKTNALNTELNNRLNNENLSKEQRASIQNQIAQNDEKLRVKQEAIEKKKFKMNKAANIAKALIDTASAAAGVMADSKGDFFARLAQAIPTIAFGLAQVATIARQKFQSSASKTPISTTGGGGAGGARPEPSFNVVGRSGDSLLINAIQAQFGQPLKAYVVSREVTSQQQLDGIIVNQAST